MRVLVTGGTGVVGRETVTRLVERDHQVRLVSRGAERDAREWERGVEAVAADIGDADALRGAADGCDAALHLAGIVSESPPEITFEKVNVEGTRTLVDEARRAGVRRFVYVSSLGAERGASDYHRSKYAAESFVREFPGTWTICRLANVYGPGDAVISVLLRWVRATPVLPVIDWGETEFQPIWLDDAAAALVAMVERDDLGGRVLEVAGAERTSLADLVERLGRLVGHTPLTIPVPSPLVSFAAWVGKTLGMDVPVDPGQITMLNEGSVVRAPEGNALETVLGLRATPLADGLRRLADSAPEQRPKDGVGDLERKRFRVEVEDARLDAPALMEELRNRFDELTPWTVSLAPEPGTPTRLEEGETVTMQLPGRGNIQVRVVELAPTRLTMLTLEGHPLAGGVHFAFDDLAPGRLRLTIEVFDRTSGLLDWLMMHPVGGALQSYTWQTLLARLAEASGGRAVGEPEHETTVLDEDSADEVDTWVEELILRRRRQAHAEDAPVESVQHATRPRAE